MLSCNHSWKLASEISRVSNFEYCSTCGATCSREDGKIVEYDRVAGYGRRYDSDVQAYNQADRAYAEVQDATTNGHNADDRHSRR